LISLGAEGEEGIEAGAEAVEDGGMFDEEEVCTART
jgi:hypothetical protein